MTAPKKATATKPRPTAKERAQAAEIKQLRAQLAGDDNVAGVAKQGAKVRVGARVSFASDSGVQHGEVIRLDTAQLADDSIVDAACVAWVTGGESGPIPTELLEVR